MNNDLETLSNDQDQVETTRQEDQAEDLLTTNTSPEAVIEREAQVRSALKALREAEVQIYNLHSTIRKISMMLPPANDDAIDGIVCIDVTFVPFSHVGKEVRNNLLADLYTNLESLEDSIKATWRSVKSVKRSRLTEEQVDRLIISAKNF